ncbi:MAG: hypothetical protein HUK26_06905 [Duodenibacillus sp.]|nr:hypothetical protein [Duodenibacillus sp.]
MSMLDAPLIIGLWEQGAASGHIAYMLGCDAGHVEHALRGCGGRRASRMRYPSVWSRNLTRAVHSMLVSAALAAQGLPPDGDLPAGTALKPEAALAAVEYVRAALDSAGGGLVTLGRPSGEAFTGTWALARIALAFKYGSRAVRCPECGLSCWLDPRASAALPADAPAVFGELDSGGGARPRSCPFCGIRRGVSRDFSRGRSSLAGKRLQEAALPVKKAPGR